jgi:hypothetical protein
MAVCRFCGETRVRWVREDPRDSSLSVAENSALLRNPASGGWRLVSSVELDISTGEPRRHSCPLARAYYFARGQHDSLTQQTIDNWLDANPRGTNNETVVSSILATVQVPTRQAENPLNSMNQAWNELYGNGNSVVVSGTPLNPPDSISETPGRNNSFFSNIAAAGRNVLNSMQAAGIGAGIGGGLGGTYTMVNRQQRESTYADGVIGSYGPQQPIYSIDSEGFSGPSNLPPRDPAVVPRAWRGIWVPGEDYDVGDVVASENMADHSVFFLNYTTDNNSQQQPRVSNNWRHLQTRQQRMLVDILDVFKSGKIVINSPPHRAIKL